MARNSTTKTGLESRTREKIFSSPVALAFVRTVVALRGISETEARQIYLDYINRSPRSADHRGRRVMT
ncbi:hypothetical protein JQ596_32435 [Bradyrhizobium manausense]|uniref:hypothetical protein n=1 Tax=Bradyrhizobium TaxID=374 RepID=UPI001BA480B3|nr:MULTISPECIES: hypothetical protein [Bradyrhizobium]MBR0830249.1 hypothetical protein [Bradyrhizobium manausense]UVO33600.1 hypothetical protein KUF59_13350 [Bradyrhizobium arachidis]